MIKFENKDYYILERCSICDSKDNVKLINFISNNNGNGTLICLCKQCREQLKNLLEEEDDDNL